MNNDLKKIKKNFGESAMKFCRKNFPLLLDQPGLLPDLLNECIYDGRAFFKDLLSSNQINNFKSYIYDLASMEEECDSITNQKSASELLSEKNYQLFICKTKEDVEQFKKYYRPDELLCTFNSIDRRLKTCHVFWIVRKELIENLNYFDNCRKMKRQDEYGTSCCSIQFSKNGGYLSIKNRYNHKVTNCDATFSNNLDNIAHGLSDAFEREFDLNFDRNKCKVNLPNWVLISGKFYKYKQEINGRHFGINWYQTDNGVIELNKDYQRIIDGHYLLDLKEKSLHNLLDYNKDMDLNFHKIVIFKDEDEFRASPDEINVLKILDL